MSQAIMKGSQGRSLKQKPRDKVFPGLLPLACTQPDFSTAQTNLPSGGEAYSWLSLLCQSIKCPTDIPTDQSDEGILSVEVPSSQIVDKQVDNQNWPSHEYNLESGSKALPEPSLPLYILKSCSLQVTLPQKTSPGKRNLENPRVHCIDLVILPFAALPQARLLNISYAGTLVLETHKLSNIQILPQKFQLSQMFNTSPPGSYVSNLC